MLVRTPTPYTCRLMDCEHKPWDGHSGAGNRQFQMLAKFQAVVQMIVIDKLSLLCERAGPWQIFWLTTYIQTLWGRRRMLYSRTTVHIQCIAAEIMPIVRVSDGYCCCVRCDGEKFLNLIYGRNTFFFAKF